MQHHLTEVMCVVLMFPRGITVRCSPAVPNPSDDASPCVVWQQKTPGTEPMFILLASHLLILFGASRLRVNKNIVPQLSTSFSPLCSCSLQSPQLSEHLLTFLTESLCLIFLFSARVCSPLMEFRERYSSVCPSHMPSAFTASTRCAGGECWLLFFTCATACKFKMSDFL